MSFTKPGQLKLGLQGFKEHKEEQTKPKMELDIGDTHSTPHIDTTPEGYILKNSKPKISPLLSRRP